jgi:PAS domain S-box-containing protein
MNYLKNDNERNINSILAVVKFGMVFFCIILMLHEVATKKGFVSNISHTFPSFIAFVITLPLMFVIYLVWSHLYLKRKNFPWHRNALIVENIIYIAFFSLLIILTNSYESDFKYLFLFIIIPSVIQLGSRFGIIMALISSAIVLSIDLIYVPTSSINTYFQSDLILATALVSVAWTLGKYVDLQRENMDKKNAELQILNVKLTEQELQRRYIEDMILKNETCYNLLINNSNSAIFVHRNNELLFSNESAAQLTGFDLDTLIHKSILDFADIEERDTVKSLYKNIYNNTLNTISFEQKLIGINATVAAVENTSTSFIYEGKPTILTILHDITSRKQVEILQQDVQRNMELLKETREFNKLITEFFSNISHELKTPLNIIFSTVQLLDLQDRNKSLQDKDKYFSIMKQNCYRLMRLINNLLDITRADSGFLTPHMKNDNIVNVVEDITMSVVTFADSKGINLIFDTDCEEKVMAFDPDKLERIVLNLLSNALKFTNTNGEILVSIADKNEYILLTVKDTGIGIPEDKYQLIFQRFHQVDKTFTRNHEGSGIGLALVKSFVEMHQGTIEVCSKIGQGSEFTIKLPVSLCSEGYSEKDYTNNSIIERINIEFSDIYS